MSVEGTSLPGSPSPEELLADDVKWTSLVPRTPVGGHAANGFAIATEQRFTHLRVNQHPDGGIARLRVYGEVVPDPNWLAALGTFDVVALENGGSAEDASNLFYSPASNTIQPGRSRKMDDGWETRRRRDQGNDWISYRLAAQSRIRALEIDTAYLKGNSGKLGLGIGTGRRHRRLDRDPSAHPPPARHQPPLRPPHPGDRDARTRGHLSRRRDLAAAAVRLADGAGGDDARGEAPGARRLTRASRTPDRHRRPVRRLRDAGRHTPPAPGTGTATRYVLLS